MGVRYACGGLPVENVPVENMPVENARLRIAIQKSGRLSEDSFDLLKQCGLTVSRSRDALFGRVQELPIDVLLVRDDDIPAFVADGASDIGIVGENVFAEYAAGQGHGALPDIAKRLGFSRCRLMIAGPKGWTWRGAASVDGLKIATSYPGLTRAYLAQAGVSADIVVMQGAVEIAPQLNIADAICDIVATGATLDAHGLKPFDTVFQSEAVLIRAAKLSRPAHETLEALTKRIDGVLASRDAKYVMMNAPRSAVAAITAVLPGAESPTVLELAGAPDKVAIHAVCRESVFWETLERLKAHGASAILVLPIEKMMP